MNFTRTLHCLAMAILLAGPALAARADLAVRFVLADGSKVSDIATVEARVTGAEDVGVQKVEFTVDGQVAGSDVSTPYTLEWDTLAVQEGQHKIAARATDANGATASAEVSLVVDNELARGADYHADQALEAVKSGDLDAAARSARRALKLQPGNVRAARALAAIWRKRGELAKALDVLNAANPAADDVESMRAIIAMTIARGDAMGDVQEFLTASASAVEIARKHWGARIAALPKDAPAVEAGDAFFAAHAYGDAIKAYQRAGDALTAPLAAVNRLLLAYVVSNRQKEAETLVKSLTREKRSDDVTCAVIGLWRLSRQEVKAAREVVAEAATREVLPAMIVLAVCDLATGARKKATPTIERIAAIAPDLPEVLLLKSFIETDAQDARRDISLALQSDPAMIEAYVVRAYQMALGRDAKRYNLAEDLLNAALKIEPKNYYASQAMAAVLMARERPQEADMYVQQILTTMPNAPDAMVTRAALCVFLDKSAEITTLLDRARKVDEDHWNFVYAPKPAELLAALYQRRISPGVTPASLYPATR